MCELGVDALESCIFVELISWCYCSAVPGRAVFTLCAVFVVQ